MEQLRKRLLNRRAAFLAFVALGLCALAALVGFCLPRAIGPTIPAPITRAPTLTETPFEVTRVFTHTPTQTAALPRVETVTSTPTMPPTLTATPTLSPTLQNTDTPTPTRINTLVPGRNGTMPTTGAAMVSYAWLTILGVTLCAVGAILLDAASKDNPTW